MIYVAADIAADIIYYDCRLLRHDATLRRAAPLPLLRASDIIFVTLRARHAKRCRQQRSATAARDADICARSIR